MPKRKKSWLVIRLEYCAARIFMAVVGMFSYRRGFAIARVLAGLLYRLDRRHRDRALENLRAAFPYMTDAERRLIIKSVYCHLFESAVETLAMLRLMEKGDLQDYISVEGQEALEKTAALGTGIIFVTGHIGSWELLGMLSARYGYPLWSLARPLDNPLLNDLVVGIREKLGQRILNRRGAMVHALKLLRDGQYLAFLIDQNARRGGIFVPFFGRPASTHTSVARISIKTGCPVFFSYAVRRGDKLHFDVKIAGPLWPRVEADEEEEIYRITAVLTSWLEDAVRKYPDRWLWLHRRWKTQPGPGEKYFQEA